HISELTDVVLLVCTSLVNDKPIELVNNIKTSTPMVMADENRLQQILYNLVGNAIKYTEHGQVTVYAYVQNDFLKVCVTDTGRGIAEKQLETIFQPFQEGDLGMFSQEDGTGIGLNITKQLVELHHGEINVVSEIGCGSEFSFTL